jgi:hypothetical protein
MMMENALNNKVFSKNGNELSSKNKSSTPISIVEGLIAPVYLVRGT